MKINLLIETAPPPRQPQAPTSSVEDKVRNALDCIDSGYESPMEWRMVCKLFQALLAKHAPSRREKNLLAMIQPVLAKYGYHESIPPAA